MRRESWSSFIIIGLIFLGATTFLVARHLVRTSPSMARRANAPLPVSTVAAAEHTLIEAIGASGEVQPVALVNLTAEATGRVEAVSADIGEMVQSEQVLVRFDRKLPEAALKTAQAALGQAAGEHQRAREDLARIERVYEQDLFHAAVRTAQAALEQAAGERQRAERNWARTLAIHEQGLLPRIEVEKAQAIVEKAVLLHSEAQENLLRVEKDLRAEVNRARAAVAAANAKHSEAEEQLIRAQQALAGATLVSPVVGIIMDRVVSVGEIPPSGQQKILTIGRIDEVLVEARIGEERVGEIHVGQAAAVTFSAFPHEVFSGKVVKMKPVADPETRTFLV